MDVTGILHVPGYPVARVSGLGEGRILLQWMQRKQNVDDTKRVLSVVSIVS